MKIFKNITIATRDHLYVFLEVVTLSFLQSGRIYHRQRKTDRNLMSLYGC
jgi:hypothetical protein